MSYVSKSEYDKLVNENHDLRQKLENFIPRRRVRRAYKRIHSLLDINGITRAYQLETDKIFEEILGE